MLYKSVLIQSLNVNSNQFMGINPGIFPTTLSKVVCVYIAPEIQVIYMTTQILMPQHLMPSSLCWFGSS